MGTDEERLIFSRALTHDRVQRGMSQHSLSKELKVVQQTLSKWEKGTTLPRDYRIHQIVEYFGKESHTAQAAQAIMEGRDRDAVRVVPPAKYVDVKVVPQEYVMPVNRDVPDVKLSGGDDMGASALLRRVIKVAPERRMAFSMRLIDAMVKLSEAKRELELLDDDLDEELGEH